MQVKVQGSHITLLKIDTLHLLAKKIEHKGKSMISVLYILGGDFRKIAEWFPP